MPAINDISTIGRIPVQLEMFGKKSLFPRADHIHATQRDALTLDGLLKTQFLRSDDADSMEASAAGDLLLINNTHASGDILECQRNGSARLNVNEDFTIILGDSVGAKKVIIKDSGGNTIATIDSDGNLSIKGRMLSL